MCYDVADRYRDLQRQIDRRHVTGAKDSSEEEATKTRTSSNGNSKTHMSVPAVPLNSRVENKAIDTDDNQ